MSSVIVCQPNLLVSSRTRVRAAPSTGCSSAPMPLTASEIAGSRTSLTVHARNFKTRDTEKQIEKSVPDSDELNSKVQEYVDTIKAKWDETDEKPAVVAVGFAAFVAIWALSGLVDRLDKLPLVGGFLELVGLLVTGWFTYRYLTFAPDREELKKSVDTFYQKVTGKKSW